MNGVLYLDPATWREYVGLINVAVAESDTFECGICGAVKVHDPDCAIAVHILKMAKGGWSVQVADAAYANRA